MSSEGQWRGGRQVEICGLSWVGKSEEIDRTGHRD